MNYHNILHDDMLNGDGMRVTLFVSGCSLHCKNCQNPCTWNFDGGISFDDDAKCEIFNELSKDYISGITLTGGHPLEPQNLGECEQLCKTIKNKFPQKNIWIYTGYKYEKIKDYSILDYVDVLVDGSYVDELRDISLKWRGSKNQRVIDVQKSRQNNQVILHCE